MGHFCPAQDFNRDDDPACAPCLQGLPCTPRQVRSKEFDKAVDPEPKVSATKPSPPKPDPLRGEKLAETMEQQAAKPGPCAWGCGKPRHRGVCAARRAALSDTGTKFAGFAPALVDRYARRDVVPDTAHVDEQLSDLPTARERVGLMPERCEQKQLVAGPRITSGVGELSAAVATTTLKTIRTPDTVKALGQPVFEVVSRSQVQLRAERSDPYAELADRLRRLGPGDLLKISLPSKAAADSYAKNFSRRLRKYKLRVKYERHGDVIFLEVKPPVLSTSEVPAP
jgi:hypothetical protein